MVARTRAPVFSPRMGHTTDFLGHINVEPRLNDAEVAYLTAFSKSRRCDRAGGPYAVPMNPYVDDADALDTETANRTPDGQPGYRCHWVPCVDGCCLAYDGNEKFYGPDRWLAYLIDHFLRPGALAAASGEHWFRGLHLRPRAQWPDRRPPSRHPRDVRPPRAGQRVVEGGARRGRPDLGTTRPLPMRTRSTATRSGG